MADLSQQDLDVRLQLSGQRYSAMLSTYIDNLRYGKKDSGLLEYKLFILDKYIDLLLGYAVCGCNVDCTNNCITEEEAQQICNNISKIANIYFQPSGFRYTGVGAAQSGIGKMVIGCSFIVS